MTFTRLLLALSALMLVFSAQAEQKKTLGNWDVHYMVLSTTFLTPEVARGAGITRSKNNALVNVSVLNRRSKEAQSVKVTGDVRDLLGNHKPLEFREVKDGDAIYYLATFSFSDKDHYRFSINIQDGNQRQTLKFQQQMYKD